MLRFVFRLLLLALVLAALAIGAFVYWAARPLPLPAARVDFSIPPGSGMRAVARHLNEAGIAVQPDLFVVLSRVSGLDTQVKAGGYEVTQGDSLWQVLQRMAAGDVTHARITFIEGWTYRQFRDALQRHPDVRQTLDGVDDQQLLQRLGETEAKHAEGLFFPDTYSFAKGSSDFDILRRAWQAQHDQLAQAWASRVPDLPWKSPYELLIMASIVEKETGHKIDRAKVAGVFVNRLRVKMPLQTDPTVIYGMGEAYTGTLLRRHLREDSEWNTYTRPGLPPTPIANPGRASLDAAAHPESHKYYYFVSRGDGSSAFATDLANHNRNVNRYIRGAEAQ
ncbi:endolytic transglycosylase MltG [Verticiella sediminum]|uniref:Endolytic murein transglycosylase n=1 Tax=Verticiella sediminum TaxID=1247510 RepID=A0A556AY60_9BURK|nr:endolytic transglycosylase MltG [Verticiella sediminum]TSH97870.1 endolytic transglycosylase MltG [Verticiella sediminum]